VEILVIKLLAINAIDVAFYFYLARDAVVNDAGFPMRC